MTDVVVTPNVGSCPVNVQAGPGASPGFDAIDYRRAWASGLSEGVLSTGAWKAHQDTGVDLSLIVDADVAGAHVQGDAVVDQGVYYVPPHSAAITFDVGTSYPPDPSSPRVDRVVLHVQDDTHDGSGFNRAIVSYLEGTPNASATLDNETGAPSVPGGAIELATVLIPAAATAVIDANIRDKRPAGGARRYDVGEVIYKASSNAPFGAVAANGVLLKRNQHVELFAEIGTTHGAGDGSTTFALPDHQGRVPLGAGTGAGLTARVVGAKVGAETHQLTTAEIPSHSHGGVTGVDSPDHGHVISDPGHSHPTLANGYYPVGTASPGSTTAVDIYPSSGVSPGHTPAILTNGPAGATGTDTVGTGISVGGATARHSHAIGAEGGSGAHDNMQPSLGLQAYIYSGKA